MMEKICINCKHHFYKETITQEGISGNIIGYTTGEPFCRKSTIFDPVYGNENYQTCRIVRSLVLSGCTEQGRFFEQIEGENHE